RQDRDVLLGAKEVQDFGVHRATLWVEYGVARHALQEGVAEFILELNAEPFRLQDLRFDEQLQRLGDVPDVLPQERGEELRLERAAETRGRLNYAPSSRQPIQTLRHHLGQDQRHVERLTSTAMVSLPLIDERA